MHQDFDREVLSRLPLAEATLLLWQFVCDDASLHELYDRHRGRTYHKKIPFPLMAQLVRDALLEPEGSGHKSFCQAQQNGILPAVLSSTYDKLAHLPPAVSEAFLAEGADRLRQVFPDNEVERLDDPIAPSLGDFEILVLDGKVVKRVPRRLRPARQCKGGLLGGKGLVALHLRSGLALALATDPDGEANKSPRLKESFAFPPYKFLTFSNGTAIFHDLDKGILLVDVLSKQSRTISLPEKDRIVVAAAYSPKGKFLVADGEVLRRWDLGDKHTTLRYSCPVGPPMPNLYSPKGSPILSLAVSPDRTNIAVTTADKTIRLLNAADGSVIKKLDIDSDSQNQHLLYSNDGKMLISIEPVGHNAQPSLIRFWDVKKGVEIRPPYVGHKSRIISCCLSPDNLLLATGSYDGSVLVWKVPSLTPKKKKVEILERDNRRAD